MSLEISLETQTRLADEAQKAGVSVDTWLRQLMHEHEIATGTPSESSNASSGQVDVPSIGHLQKTNPEEWARQFRAWADSHDPKIPVLSDEAMSRDSIYPDLT